MYFLKAFLGLTIFCISEGAFIAFLDLNLTPASEISLCFILIGIIYFWENIKKCWKGVS